MNQPKAITIDGPLYIHCANCDLTMLIFGPNCERCGYCDESYFTNPCLEAEYEVQPVKGVPCSGSLSAPTAAKRSATSVER